MKARVAEEGDGVQVMIFTPDQKELFVRLTGFFGRLGFTIIDAKVHTTRAGYALDTFQVTSPQLEGQDTAHYRDLISLVETQLAHALSATGPLP